MSLTHEFPDAGSDRPLHGVSIHFRSTPEALPRFSRALRAVLAEARIDRPVAARAAAAALAGVVDAVEHGSPEGIRNHVDVELVVHEREIVLSIQDQRQPVTAAKADQSCTDLSLADSIAFLQRPEGRTLRLSFAHP